MRSAIALWGKNFQAVPSHKREQCAGYSTSSAALARCRPATPAMSLSLDKAELDSDGFVALLGKLIGEAKQLQNNPPDCVPVEDRGGVWEPP